MKDSEHLEVFLSFLRDTSAQAGQSTEDWQETDKQTQDILHRLELYSDSYHETARLGKLLRQVHQRRRKAKEAYERTKPIADWCQENKASIKSLERLLGAVRKAEERQQSRMWAPKTDVLDKEKNLNQKGDAHGITGNAGQLPIPAGEEGSPFPADQREQRRHRGGKGADRPADD